MAAGSLVGFTFRTRRGQKNRRSPLSIMSQRDEKAPTLGSPSGPRIGDDGSWLNLIEIASAFTDIHSSRSPSLPFRCTCKP
jgi:hypothetical protein